MYETLTHYIEVRLKDRKVIANLQKSICSGEPLLEIYKLGSSTINLFGIKCPEDKVNELIAAFESIVQANGQNLSVELHGLGTRTDSEGHYTVFVKFDLDRKTTELFDRIRAALNEIAVVKKQDYTVDLFDTKLKGCAAPKPLAELYPDLLNKYQDIKHGKETIQSLRLMSSENIKMSEMPKPFWKERRENRPRREVPNMFIAVQISSPAIHAAMRRTQIAVISSLPVAHGGHTDVSKAHLTLNVFKADGQEDIDKAVQACKSAVAAMEGKPVEINFNGIGHFNNKVLFMHPVADDGMARLRLLQKEVTAGLTGLAALDNRPYNPHATMFNMGKHRKREHQRDKIGKEVWEGLPKEFGREVITSVQVLSMNDPSVDGYYARAAEDINFAHAQREENIDLEKGTAEDSKVVHKECCFTKLPVPVRKPVPGPEPQCGAGGSGAGVLGLTFLLGIVAGAMLMFTALKQRETPKFKT